MRFTWRGLALAPLLAPVVCSAALCILLGGVRANPLVAFAVLMIPSCIVSYGAVVCLFLPSLYLLSRLGRASLLSASLLGLVLGAAAYLPLVALAWASSGPDSGPPSENPLTFALRWLTDPMTAIFPAAGLVTAAVYWRLSAPAPPAPRSGPTPRGAVG